MGKRACLLLGAALLAAAGQQVTVFGAAMIPNAKKVEEGRYASPRDYDATAKFYRDLFKGAPNITWKKIVNLPGTRAVHVANSDEKSGWEGINIYENKGEVRIFVIKRQKEEKKK